MAARVIRYYHSTTMAADYCDHCAPAIFGIVADLTQTRLGLGRDFVCALCDQRTEAS